MGKTKKKNACRAWSAARALAAAFFLTAPTAQADHAEGRNAVALGPMLQKEFGRLQANANLLFERQLGAHADRGAEIDYAWQLKWRGDARFEPGAQGFGALGRTNDFARETKHKIG